MANGDVIIHGRQWFGTPRQSRSCEELEFMGADRTADTGIPRYLVDVVCEGLYDKNNTLALVRG